MRIKLVVSKPARSGRPHRHARRELVYCRLVHNFHLAVPQRKREYPAFRSLRRRNRILFSSIFSSFLLLHKVYTSMPLLFFLSYQLGVYISLIRSSYIVYRVTGFQPLFSIFISVYRRYLTGFTAPPFHLSFPSVEWTDVFHWRMSFRVWKGEGKKWFCLVLSLLWDVMHTL